MGEIGRARIEGAFGWPYQRTTYVQVYDRLVGRVSVPQPRVVAFPDTEAASTAASAAARAERAPDVHPSVAGLDD
jgi:hypothetical protein